MKAFQNVVSAAVALGALSFANAAALSDSSAAPSASASVTSLFPSISVGDTSSAPTSTETDTGFPTSTGGYVVTGVYTTCLTLTFAEPTPTPTDPGAFSTGVGASDTPLPSDVNPGGPIQSVGARQIKSKKASSSLSLSPSGPIQSGSVPLISGSSSATSPGGPITPTSGAVFTTCLVFLPSSTPCASASVTTPPGAPTSSVAPSASASALPSASESGIAVGSSFAAPSASSGL
ncbi:hypothetical protein DFH06DRAFT_1292720 [Mycena polygramma]|nr:hypothetical protein DFH06DRAFT_1292720 [Mycena polygramma]